MRLALRVLQFGAIAIVLAVTTFFSFELDRFFIPKELVLHATAVIAALLAIATLREATTTTIDRLLAFYIALGALSAAFATNRWLGMRALAISASSVLLFWVARRLRESGYARNVVNALAVAVVAVAVTSLLQTYGLATTLFSENRIPGGTLGNRNFVAHVAAFGLPLVLLAALGAQRRFFFGAAGAALATASLVLTRSRAAWLAFAAVVVVFVIAMIASPPLRRDGRTWRRLFAVVVFVAIGVAAALLLPNALRWRSRNPYLQTVQHVTDYESGSGRGRLVQYEQTLRMALHHPLFGVGPGNWAVDYPAHAARNDPSLSDGDPGMTTNPWPSSDWFAWIAERGPLAVVLLALAFLGIAASGVRQLFAAQEAGDGLAAAALLATVAGAVVTGLFDAVLLLALPAFLVWAALGALVSPPPKHRPLPALAIMAILLLSAGGAARSVAQLAAMHMYETHGDHASLTSAAHVDPGNYRLQLRLARMGGRSRCVHARAAHALYPNAGAAAQLMRGCR
ncbi:MAG TPA: O-antigen ligase family protein [Thermoanaerobaculia bacterium]|nr:O-antigen ligase family protein [Thermoanaerobaculia bacterium]